ncbi:MAG: hypothetical protein GEV00_10585 [Actinophytocola sp.]|nr:hypothetical protein [Actinophytocola sp.]
MYFDDFIAHQILQTDDSPSSRLAGAQPPDRGLLRSLWRRARQLAWGIDAFSSVRHGIDVPADHGARSRPPSPRS